MPSGLRKTSGNHFEIYYEAPWGGVASDKDPVDIGPNQLVAQQGMVVVDSVLCSIGVEASFNLLSVPYYQQTFESFSVNSVITAIFVLQGAIFGVDVFGAVWILETSGIININWVQYNPGSGVVTAPGYPWPVNSVGILEYNGVSAVQVINSVAYLAVYTQNTLYTFDGTTFAIASDYTAGTVMAVLDDYLLQLNTNNSVDGPQPTRVNWSAPGEFSTWDPSVNRAAGFNTLASIEDQLTGFFSLASVGLAISHKSMVELSPTGVGIRPFNFTTLWTSQVGQGCIYPNSVSQFGMLGFLATDTGVYNVTTSNGFQDITGSASKAILNTFRQTYDTINNTSSDVAGAILLYFYSTLYTTPFYVLCNYLPPDVTNFNRILNIWLMDAKTGIWQQLQFDLLTLVNSQNNVNLTSCYAVSLNVQTLDSTPVQGIAKIAGSYAFPTPTTIISGIAQDGNQVYNYMLVLNIYNNVSTPSLATIYSPINLVFKVEEIKLGYTRKPTIRRIVVRGYGVGVLTLTLTGVVDGTSVTKAMGIIMMNSTTTQSYYSPSGVATMEDPQLTITGSATATIVITKVMLAGTYADGEID